MTKTAGIPKRWRPRFSLRTLVLFVTLVCIYFGAWEATKRYGVPAVSEFAEPGVTWIDFPSHATSALPFCVRIREQRVTDRPGFGGWCVDEYRCDYLWIFGWIVHVKDEGPSM